MKLHYFKKHFLSSCVTKHGTHTCLVFANLKVIMNASHKIMGCMCCIINIHTSIIIKKEREREGLPYFGDHGGCLNVSYSSLHGHEQ